MKNYRTSTIFDFKISYLGKIKIKEDVLPIKLYFSGNEIRLAIITENLSLSYLWYQSDKVPLNGEVYTIEGLKRLKAIASLVNCSENFNGTSFYEFRLWSMFIYGVDKLSIENNYSKVNLTFKNLHKIGKLIDLTPNNYSEYPYNINRTTDEVILLDNVDERISFKNELIYHTSFSEQQVNISTDAYIEIKKEGMTIEYIEEKIKSIGWFLQLIFRNRQDENGVFLFPHDYSKNTEAFYYYRSEIIECLKTSYQTFINPSYYLEELQAEMLIGYKRWNDFNMKQKLFCRLFFNELNSKHIVLDDRFKNLCALIQGLELFGEKKTRNKVKNGNQNSMACKLASTAEHLTALYFNDIQQSFLDKLYLVIGFQRDFYQHMDKTLIYDLGAENNDLNIVNQFLEFIIKAHLIRNIGLENKSNQMLSSDRNFVNFSLKDLQKKFNQKGLIA